jgi:hypothetical protein
MADIFLITVELGSIEFALPLKTSKKLLGFLNFLESEVVD